MDPDPPGTVTAHMSSHCLHCPHCDAEMLVGDECEGTFPCVHDAVCSACGTGYEVYGAGLGDCAPFYLDEQDAWHAMVGAATPPAEFPEQLRFMTEMRRRTHREMAAQPLVRQPGFLIKDLT